MRLLGHDDNDISCHSSDDVRSCGRDFSYLEFLIVSEVYGLNKKHSLPIWKKFPAFFRKGSGPGGKMAQEGKFGFSAFSLLQHPYFKPPENALV